MCFSVSNMSAALTNRKYFKSLIVRKKRVSGKEQERTLLRKYFKSPIINRPREEERRSWYVRKLWSDG